MGLLDQWEALKGYIQANTPRNTRPAVSPAKVINEGLLNPNKYNEVAANRFKDSAFGLLGVVPGLGDAASAVESADLFKRGDNFAGGMAALGALPLVPAFAGMVKQGGNVADALGPAMSKADEAAQKGGGLLGKVDDGIEFVDNLEWKPAVGPKGTLKKQYLARRTLPNGSTERVGRMLVYKYPDGNVGLSDIAVDPNFQRRGIATNLFNRAIDETGAQGMYGDTGFSGQGLEWARKMGVIQKDAKQYIPATKAKK